LFAEKRPYVSAGLAFISVLVTGTATLVNAAPEKTAYPLRDDSLPKLFAGEHAYSIGEMFGMNPHVAALSALMLVIITVFWIWRDLKRVETAAP
jgi:hypothetical protein